MQQSQSILTLIGPTGAGKTQCSLLLAQHQNIELISIDSMLVYQGLDIGTAKPTLSEQQMVPHHMIDVCSPEVDYSVAPYCQAVHTVIQAIRKRGRKPVLVGGSMMYVWALLNGLSALPSRDLAYRAEIEQQAEREGWPKLWAQLRSLDPQSADQIAPHDRQRIGRALEVIHQTGQPYSAALQSKPVDQLAMSIVSIWPEDRALLYQNLNQRFEEMLDRGLVKEVEALYARHPKLTRQAVAMRGVGYRQVSDYLAGDIAYNVMRVKAKQATRHLAKRQLTWMRRISSQKFTVGQTGILARSELMAQCAHHLEGGSK